MLRINQIYLSGLASFGVLLFGALAFGLDSGYSVGPFILLVLALGIAPWSLATFNRLDKETLWLVFAFGMMLLAWLSGTVVDIEFKARLLDKPSRIFAALLVLVALFHLRPPLLFLLIGIAIGGLSAGWIAYTDVMKVGMGRADGYYNAIQFGGLALIWSSICYFLAVGLIADMKWSSWMKVFILMLMLVCSGSALMAAVLSGSRGVWLAIPLVVLIALVGSFESRKKQLTFFLVAVIVSATVFLMVDGLWARIDLALKEFESYFSHGQSYTSVGLRLEMWKSALMLVVEKPILGWGEYGYREALAEHARLGIVDASLIGFQHAHNHYLDMFAKHGVIGFISLLGFIFIPLFLFLRYIKVPCGLSRSLALSGVVVTVCFAVFSLTQAFLWHVNGITVYSFMVVILWYYLRQSLDEMADKESVRQA